MTSPSHTGTFNTVSVGTSQVTLVAADSRRKSVLIQNVHATAKVYVGVGVTGTVTTANGIRLSPDDSIEISSYLGPVYAISDTASTDVRFLQMGGS